VCNCWISNFGGSICLEAGSLKFVDPPLETHAFPVIGDMPLSKIDTAVVLRTIMPVWERTPETGSRLRGRIERVMDWAKPLGYFQGEILPNGIC
jgi:hypothetical protein